MQELVAAIPPPVRRLLEVFHVDFAPDHAQPSLGLWAVALIAANVVSLCSDAILVAIGTAIFPSVRDFQHFQFSDYGKLTVVGVTVACVAWPVVTRISSRPRWLLLRLGALVTLVLWLPDLYILWILREPIRGVGVLMVMHLAIAFITYNALVRIAPVGEGPSPATLAGDAGTSGT